MGSPGGGFAQTDRQTEETQTGMKPSNCVAGRILAKRNVSLEMGLEQALQEAREDFAYSAFHGLGAVAIAVPLCICVWVCVSLSLSIPQRTPERLPLCLQRSSRERDWKEQ
jgi:hypothetical protein